MATSTPLPKNRYAVVIGTGQYDVEAGVKDLPFATNDAKAVARLFRNRRIGQFPEHNVILILDGHSQFIQRKLEQIFMRAERDDLVVVYFSCHGDKDKSGDLYLLTHDSRRGLYLTSAIPIAFIKTLMEKTVSRRQVLILDCCFSGAFGKDLIAKGMDETISLDELRGRGRYVMAATSSIQYAFPDERQKYSLFTRFLVEGLETGQADVDQDGLISVKELSEYVEPRVFEASGGSQRPVSWDLEVAGNVFIARSRRGLSPLVTDLKLDPSRVMRMVSNWGVDEFKVKDGFPLDDELIPRPILTRRELDKCYLPSPLVKDIQREVRASKPGTTWLFVSPEGTGKTSLLTYLSADETGEKPHRKVIKVTRVPDEPSIDEFVNRLKSGEVAPSKSIIVFDGNILEQGCAQLLLRIATSKRQMSVWATCTPGQYEELLEKEPELAQYLVVRNVPGYIDADESFFRSFVYSKFGELLPESGKEEQLKRTNVTMNELCSFYSLLMRGTIPRQAISPRDVREEIGQLFYSMPLQAQLLARIVHHFGSLPEEIAQLLVARTDLFRKEDYELILKRQFVFVESGVSALLPALVKPAAQMRQVGSVGLLAHEWRLVVNALLDLAEQEQDRVRMALFLKMLTVVSQELDEVQQRRYRQLVRRAEGGQLCDVCGVYYPAELEWCPTCGRELPADSEVLVDTTIHISDDSLDSVPFPQAQFCSDVGRAEFVWSQLDLSAFDDLDK